MRRLIPLVPSRQTQQVQSKRPIQRGIGSAAMCWRPLAATSACSGEWRDAEAFRSTSALVGAADHGSRTVAALGAGDRDRLPLGPRTHSRPPAPACLFAAGFPVDERAMNFRSLRVDTDISRSSSSRRRSSRKCGANTRLCSIASTLVSNSTPMRSLSGTPSFMSKKMFASLSPRLLCRSLDHGKSPTQGGHLKWFAGMWGLVPR